MEEQKSPLRAEVERVAEATGLAGSSVCGLALKDGKKYRRLLRRDRRDGRDIEKLRSFEAERAEKASGVEGDTAPPEAAE